MADEKVGVLELLARLLPDRCEPAAFSGILTEPLREPDWLEIALLTCGHTDPLRWKIEEEIINFVNEQKAARLLALAEHYGLNLDAEDWAPQLVLSMAEQFVPGFRSRPVSKPGRPQATSLAIRFKGGTGATNIDFVDEVLRLTKSGKSVLSACTILCEKRGTPWSGRTPRALAAQFTRTLTAIQRDMARPDPLHDRIRAVIDQHKSSGN